MIKPQKPMMADELPIGALFLNRNENFCMVVGDEVFLIKRVVAFDFGKNPIVVDRPASEISVDEIYEPSATFFLTSNGVTLAPDTNQ